MMPSRVGLIALAVFGVGCYTPPSNGQLDAASNADSNSIADGRATDAAVDGRPVDAAPGMSSLARAPKSCDVVIADPVVVQLAPSWNGAVSVSDITGLLRFFYHCNEVWAMSDRFSNGAAPTGAEPSIVLKRSDLFSAASFVMAYTVESIVQQGETDAAFAGGFVLSTTNQRFSIASIQRDPATSTLSLVTATQAGISSTLDLGNPTPPYRLRWSSVRMNDQLSTTITLYTATTTQQFPAQLMALPSADLILQIGINRFKGGQGTKMTISDLELP